MLGPASIEYVFEIQSNRIISKNIFSRKIIQNKRVEATSLTLFIGNIIMQLATEPGTLKLNDFLSKRVSRVHQHEQDQRDADQFQKGDHLTFIILTCLPDEKSWIQNGFQICHPKF